MTERELRRFIRTRQLFQHGSNIFTWWWGDVEPLDPAEDRGEELPQFLFRALKDGSPYTDCGMDYTNRMDAFLDLIQALRQV